MLRYIFLLINIYLMHLVNAQSQAIYNKSLSLENNWPVADFTFSASNPIIGQSVNINDASLNNPSVWQWTISPSTYSYINGTTNTDQNIELIFNDIGTYTINLNVSNAFGSDYSTKFIYVSDMSCDTLLHVAFPNYIIHTSNSLMFDTSYIDIDQNRPLNYMQSIEVLDVPNTYGSESPDLYVKLYDSSNVLLYTSDTLIDTYPPVQWSHMTLLGNEVYMLQVIEEDQLGHDDDLGSVHFLGTNTSNTYSNGDLEVKINTSTLGVSSNWMHKSELLNGTDSNYYIRATSFFNPSGTADDWFVFGPIDVPLGGGSVVWKHRYGDNAHRNGYRLLVNEFGSSTNNFNYGGDILYEVVDNDSLTFGDLIWTRKEVFLDPVNYGGKSLYFAFNHNSNGMWSLDLDNIQVRDCSSLITSVKHKDLKPKIGPNPAVGFIDVKMNKNHNCQLQVYDITGKCVYRDYISDCHQFKINIEAWLPGMYFLELNADKYKWHYKIVKE